MAGEFHSSGRPEENLDGITARCVGEQTAQHDRTQRCGGKPWHPQSLRDVVGVQEGFGDAHRGKAGGIARPPMPRTGLGLAVVTVLLSSRPQAVTTWSTSRGDAAVAMVRSKGR